MKCPQCSHDMTPSSDKWLCLNCGHTEAMTGTATPAATQPAAPAASTAPATGDPQPAGPTPDPPSTPAPDPGPLTTLQGTPATYDSPALPRPRRHVVRIIALVLVLLVLLSGGALAAYGYTMAPKNALGAYFSTLSGSKTGKFAATLEGHTEDDKTGENSANIKLTGSYDVRNTTAPKVEATLDGQVAKQPAKVQMVLTVKSAFFKIEQLDYFTKDTHVTIPRDWYELKYDEGLLDTNEDDKKKNCFEEQTKAFNNPTGLPSNFPVKDAKRVGLLESVDGHLVSHYHGAVDTAKLKAYYDAANAKLSNDCKLEFDEDSYKNDAIEYELYDGFGFDRLVVKGSNSEDKSVVNLTIDTKDYNKPVNINKPSGAKDIKELLTLILQAAFAQYSGEPQPGEGEPPAATSSSASQTPAHQRDIRRQTDLLALRNALEEHFVDNNAYPASLNALVPLYVKTLPKDPQTGKDYGYKKIGEDRYELRATLEEKDLDSQYNENGTLVVESIN